MENNENFVEQTENVEQTTEQIAEQPEQTFSQADVDRMVKEKLDEVLPGKIARREARIRKEYDRKYGGLVDVLKAGVGAESVEDATEKLTKFYQSKGKQIPQQASYSDRDIALLAQAEADDIIRSGYDEVVDEVDRLSEIGVSNMTPREKLLFKALAEHRQSAERSRELSSIGVTENVYNSKEFQDFASKFNPNTPATDIYNIYAKIQPKKEISTMGSMKHNQNPGVKDYYSPEEIERLTDEDLDDPKVWEAVRRSMTGR